MKFDMGDFVVNLRKSMGKTQEEFAFDLGVSRAAVNRWENRREPPAEQHLMVMARWARMAPEALLWRKRLARMESEGWDVGALFNDPEILAHYGVTLGIGGKMFRDGGDATVTPEAKKVAAMAIRGDWKELAEYGLSRLANPPNPSGPASRESNNIREVPSRESSRPHRAGRGKN